MSNTEPPGARPLQEQPCGGVVAIVDDDEDIGRALCDWLTVLEIPSRAYPCAQALLDDLDPTERPLRLKGAPQPGQPAGGGAALQCAVIDLHMPGMDGSELITRLRQLAPGLRLVLMTAANVRMRGEFIAAHDGVTCLTKPFGLDALELALGLSTWSTARPR
jgi:FixJ family two-component response regulator